MLPTNPGGHAAYQDTFVSEFLKLYPDSFANVIICCSSSFGKKMARFAPSMADNIHIWPDSYGDTKYRFTSKGTNIGCP